MFVSIADLNCSADKGFDTAQLAMTLILFYIPSNVHDGLVTQVFPNCEIVCACRGGDFQEPGG